MVHTSTAARLAAVIADALKESRISDRQAAEDTAIPRTTLTRKLRNGDFTVREIEALADLLGTTATALVALAEDEQVPA